ncbi:MAG: hypothetical protein SGJ24_18675 [Chloroflexota bacterium]|nr:hypothetical protein [Chloroflexota bacterium]
MITRLARLFAVPDYARPGHPAARRDRAGERRPDFAARLLRALAHFVIAVAVLLMGVLVASGFLTQPFGDRPSEAVYNILIVPTLLLSASLSLGAYINGISILSILRGGAAWDMLRTTPGGVRLTLLARHSATLARGGRLLIALTGVRVLLIVLLLWDMIANQGRTLELLILGITPTIGVAVAVPLLAAGMAASLLLPVTGALLDTAIGLVVASITRSRFGIILVTAAIVAVRVPLVIFLGLQRLFLLSDVPTLDAGEQWRIVVGASVVDQGYGLLHLLDGAAIWALVPYGILLGGIMLAIAVGQAWLADRLVLWAADRAQKRG